MTDVIMTEMHAIKDGNAKKYRGRYSMLLKDLQRRQDASGRVIIRVKTRSRGAALKPMSGGRSE